MGQAIGMVEAKSKLSELVGQAKFGGQTFVLQRRGQPMAVLIGVDEFERLRASAARSDVDARAPLPPALQRRQRSLVARSQRLRERLGPPEERLAEFFAGLPPQDDDFWLEIQEARRGCTSGRSKATFFGKRLPAIKQGTGPKRPSS